MDKVWACWLAVEEGSVFNSVENHFKIIFRFCIDEKSFLLAQDVYIHTVGSVEGL